MIRKIIEKCKDNKIQPWCLEDLIISGSYWLVEGNVLSLKENGELFACEKDLKKEIMKVYFNNEVKDLPEEVKKAADEGMKMLPSAWGLITDWLNGVSDYDFDDVAYEYIDNDENKARELYAYCLNKEIGDEK